MNTNIGIFLALFSLSVMGEHVLKMQASNPNMGNNATTSVSKMECICLCQAKFGRPFPGLSFRRPADEPTATWGWGEYLSKTPEAFIGPSTSDSSYLVAATSELACRTNNGVTTCTGYNVTGRRGTPFFNLYLSGALVQCAWTSKR